MAEAGAELAVTDDGVSLPAVEVLTGRGFVTGKSGSGKSNTATVVAEELLERNFALVVVDTDGEYYGLKERFEVLHAGADESCDVQVGPEHAETLASLVLEENVPLVLDVSGYLDREAATDLLTATVRALFVKEKRYKQPLLLLVEECHEYLPESGGLDEFGETLLQVAKRGRKRGLGICGMSQRPAAVDKDFVTQCDWFAWHRLTWETDTKVVARILGADYAERVEDLGDGEAVLVTDWDERVQTVQFRRMRTFDAGATPGLEAYDPPEFKPVGPELRAALDGVDDGPTGSSDAASDADGDGRQRVAELEDEAGPQGERAGGTGANAGGGRSDRRARRDDLIWESGHLLAYLVGRAHATLRAAGRGATVRCADGATALAAHVRRSRTRGTLRRDHLVLLGCLVLLVVAGALVLFPP